MPAATQDDSKLIDPVRVGAPGERWRLAPAYDLTYAPAISGHRATPIMGADRQVERADIEALGRAAGLSRHRVQRVLDDVLGAAAEVREVLDALGGTGEVSRAAATAVERTARRLERRR